MPDLLIYPVPNGTRVECLWCAEGVLLVNTGLAAARSVVEGLAGDEHECKPVPFRVA